MKVDKFTCLRDETVDGGVVYSITGLTSIEAVTLLDALTLLAKRNVEELNQAFLIDTDEGRRFEDIAFLGENLGRLARLVLELREKVEL
jgi:hypothetical protein